MGHEREGLLPKTRRWRSIVQSVASLPETDFDVSAITYETVSGVRARLRSLHTDAGVVATFKFLVTLAVASRSEQPRAMLESVGVELPQRATPLALTKIVAGLASTREGSPEYREVAVGAVADAIAAWHQQHGQQASLFSQADDPLLVWRNAGNGAGFCELARLFFAGFTARYLSYFLDREASSVLPSPEQREQFRERLQDHVAAVSRHAFESARITQSFSAGWFNKNAREGLPSDEAIEGFLFVAFGKMRDELLGEAIS